MTLDWQGLATGAVDDAVASATLLAEARGSAERFSTTPGLVTASFAALENLVVAGRSPAAWAPLSGFVRAEDGWLRLHANYPHHAAALERALGVRDRTDLDRVVAGLPAVEVESRVVAAGGIATVVRTEAAWEAHPQHAATAGRAWVEVTEHGPRRPPKPDGPPLSGVRVLDLTRVIAGPTCSQLLACLGADVLRIDPPHRPELLDAYLSNGMGKRSAVVDLGTSADVVRGDLLPRADVVLVGYRPGALDRFGLDPAQLVADRPDLVVAKLSAWGTEGPWGRRPGFDSIVQAATGIATAQADGAGRPGALPVQALDHATGYRLAAGVLRLLARARGGLVTASLLGAARELLDGPRTASEPAGPAEVRRTVVASPYGDLSAVPPPLLLDGATIERPVTGYGATAPAWRD